MATFGEAVRYMKEGGQCSFSGLTYRMKCNKLECEWIADRWRASDLYVRYDADLEVLASDNWQLLPAKPEVDWSVIPVWCNWVAADKDKQWYGYINKPRAMGIKWWSSDAIDDTFIPPAYVPEFDGDWKDSLCQRPEKS